MSLHFAKTPFILTSLLFSKKTKVQASGLAPDLLTGLMPVTTEEEPEELEDDAPCRSALRIIDTLSTSLPPAQVFPALRELISLSKKNGTIIATILEEFWENANFGIEIKNLAAEKQVVVVAEEVIDYVKGHGDKAVLVILREA